MTTAQRIETFQDLLDLLRDHPEMAQQLRLHILTEELLALPAAFAAFAAKTDAAIEALNKRMGKVETDVAEIKTDVAELKAGQKRLEADVAELKAGQKRLEIDVGELKAGQQRLQIDVGDLKGDAALRATRFVTWDIADGLGMRIVRDLTRADVRALRQDKPAADMPRHHLMSFARADAVIEAATPDGNTAYIAVEASYTADQRDTFRAIRNAHYLSRMTGQPAYAAISAARLDHNIQYLVDCGAVYWHQLTTDDFAFD